MVKTGIPIKKKIGTLITVMSELLISIIFVVTVSLTTSATSNIPLEYTNGLELDPMTFKIELAAGEIYRGSVNITNTKDTPITIKAYVKPYTNGGSGGSDGYSDVDFNVKTSQSEIVDWTSVLNNKEDGITIEAGKTRALNFVIDTPIEAGSESQNEVIFIEPTQPNADGSLHRVGVTIFAKVVKPFPIQLVVLGIIIAVITLGILSIICVIHQIKKGKKSLIKKKGSKK